MAEPVSPVKNAESPTTRPEMDFDNDEEHQQQETGTVSPLGHETPLKNATTPRKVSFQEPEQEDEAPPAKPPRPLSPHVQNENTLIEAFPSIDSKVIKAVLVASGGNVEPAFNALLSMSDPDFKAEEAAPPPQPPRPAKAQTQLEADELYARQLAEHYQTASARQPNQYNQRSSSNRRPNQQRAAYDDEEEPERNFFDDDLPVIRQNIQKGFMETQKKVNSWISDFKKKIDGEDEEDLYSGPPNAGGPGDYSGRQNFGPSRAAQMEAIRKSAEYGGRRSADIYRERQNYDQDPHELGDDEFSRLELRDEESPQLPPRHSSKAANPDLFKPTTRPPQSGPVDEVDAMDRKLAGSQGASTADKGKKWQPLTSVQPHPEDDNDPFSLGDSDDEAKKEDKEKDVNEEATERLKKAASNSVSEGAGGEKKLEESERSGSVNKEAEELLAGK